MTRRLFNTLIACMMLLMAASCSDDLRQRVLSEMIGNDSASIRFSVEGELRTRTEKANDAECSVDHAYLLFFSSGVSGAESKMLAFTRGEVSNLYPGQLKFNMPGGLQDNIEYNVIALANADYYTPEGYDNYLQYLHKSFEEEGTSGYEYVRSHLQFHTSDLITSDAPGVFPMTGIMDESNPFSFIKKDDGYEINGTVVLTRSISRIDISNLVSSKILITKVALCNHRDGSFPFNEEIPSGTLQGILANDESVMYYRNLKAPDETGIQTLTADMYCFPNRSQSISQSDHVSTGVIVAGYYYDTDTHELDKELTYYRINVGMTGYPQSLCRNFIYRICINDVKGRGKATAKEAYDEEEPMLKTSVAQEWEADTDSFVTDEFGNFIVLSKSSLFIEGSDTGMEEIKVLPSPGMEWIVMPEDMPLTSDGMPAFKAERIVGKNSFAVGAVEKNHGDGSRTARFRITGTSPKAPEPLSILFSITQSSAPETPKWATLQCDDPNVEFNEDRIDIQGFHPDIFNSFKSFSLKLKIDPEELGIDEAGVNNISVDIESDIEWPWEGMVGSKAGIGHYSMYSFTPKPDGSYTPEAPTDNSTSGFKNNGTIIITIGCMGPDDPDILRSLTLKASVKGEIIATQKYKLRIFTKPVIMDDVIVSNGTTQYLICDRNVQNFYGGNTELNPLCTKDNWVNNTSPQAYYFCTFDNLVIPFKRDIGGSSISEYRVHPEYRGYLFNPDNYKTEMPTIVNAWKDAMKDTNTERSPFYTSDCIEGWRGATSAEMKAWVTNNNLRAAKLRTFFISDVSTIDEIPICCYLPFHLTDVNSKSDCFTQFFNQSYLPNVYYPSQYVNNNGLTGGTLSGISFYIYTLNSTSSPNSKLEYTQNAVSITPYFMVRLVRNLTAQELKDYKAEYLGYGTEKSKLKPCHKDTYSEWPK